MRTAALDRPAAPAFRAAVALLTLLAILCAAPTLAAQAPEVAPPPPLPSVSLPPELDRVLRDYERAWAVSDTAALARLFATDGFVLSNNRPPIRGRPAIAGQYATASGFPLVLRALHASVGDTTGFIIGAYSNRPGGADIGKFVLALRRARGGPWEIAADIDNSSAAPRRMVMPAPGAGAPPR